MNDFVSPVSELVLVSTRVGKHSYVHTRLGLVGSRRKLNRVREGFRF